METMLQPSKQSGLGRAQIHTAHANLGESKLASRCAYVCNQCRIEWSAVDHQLPIVETGAGQGPHAPDKAHAPTLRWADESATQAFAQTLAQQPQLGNAFVTLHGDLGAGKTTLARHMLQALGVTGRIKSPTYTIVETYETDRCTVSHFDFYRFNDPQEWEDAGFRDIFASPGLKLAEWPQKAAGLLPLADLEIHLETDADSARRVTLSAHTPLGKELLQGVALPYGSTHP
jgi:tRNA threonylcarbamoyladenosine biosynthesis protein TsaE